MVDFTVPEEARLIREGVRAFIEREVQPEEKRLARLLSDESRMLTPEGLLRPEIVEATARIRRKSAAAGWYAMHMPAEVGGGGVSKVATYLAWKEVMRHGLGLNMAVLSFVEGPSPSSSP